MNMGMQISPRDPDISNVYLKYVFCLSMTYLNRQAKESLFVPSQNMFSTSKVHICKLIFFSYCFTCPFKEIL